MLAAGGDVFEGLRSFPSHTESLKQHLHSIQTTLASRYNLAPGLVSLCMRDSESRSQGDPSAAGSTQENDPFLAYYTQQAQRIITYFNHHTKSQLAVEVDTSCASWITIRKPSSQHRHHHRATPAATGPTEAKVELRARHVNRLKSAVPSTVQASAAGSPGPIAAAAKKQASPPAKMASTATSSTLRPVSSLVNGGRTLPRAKQPAPAPWSYAAGKDGTRVSPSPQAQASSHSMPKAPTAATSAAAAGTPMHASGSFAININEAIHIHSSSRRRRSRSRSVETCSTTISAGRSTGVFDVDDDEDIENDGSPGGLRHGYQDPFRAAASRKAGAGGRGGRNLFSTPPEFKGFTVPLEDDDDDEALLM